MNSFRSNRIRNTALTSAFPVNMDCLFACLDTGRHGIPKILVRIVIESVVQHFYPF